MSRLIPILLFFAAGLNAASHGYFFIAPGGASGNGHTEATIHLGAGGELGLNRWFGIGAEIGALGPTSDFTGGVVGVVSPNAYVHIPASGRWDPFVTGGYTLMFRSDHTNLANFGGGVNYWFQHNLGLLLEFRDHVTTEGSRTNFWGFRVGISFR